MCFVSKQISLLIHPSVLTRSVDFLKQHALKAGAAAILEAVLSQGEINERIMQKFKKEVRRFAELQIDDEEALREVLQR